MNEPSQTDGLTHLGHYLTRYALTAILLWIGALKFTAYEAKGIEPSPMPGQFIVKDLLFLGVSMWLTAESLRAARLRTA